jgi:hypothetical protein
VFFILVFLWALIVHYSARKAVEQEAWAFGASPMHLLERDKDDIRALYALPATWVPRLLGLACFAAILAGVSGAKKTSQLLGGRARIDASQLDGLWMAALACMAAFLIFVICRRLRTLSLHESVFGDPRSVAVETSPFWFLRMQSYRRRARDRSRPERPRGGSTKADLIAVALVSATLLCFVLAVFFPVALSVLVPRAWFVPTMLGLPLFAFSLATAVSHYLRFPVVLLIAFILAWLATLAPHFHDARLVARPVNAPARQISLETAISDWQRMSCEEDAGPKCGQRPVILALAGGASRASFLAATVVGDLIDITRAPNSGLRDFARQIFAISGVSGGAVGAAIIRSAIEDAGPGRAGPPCKSSDGLWFAAESGAGLNRFWGQSSPPMTWKGCLQTIAAGDFLSPPVLGLAFRDGWAGPLAFAKRWLPFVEGEDRAALLEHAFEARYATALAEPSSAWSRLRVALGPEKPGAGGLARPFGRPAKDFWAPILLLTGTSVDTGRRVVASELTVSYRDGAKRVFPEALDLFEELSRTVESNGSDAGTRLYKEDSPATAPDIPLSTAATLSARFPLVSPYAGLRNPVSAQTADRVVDGGYFENDGVTTAYELARAIVDLDANKNVRPIIIHITNEPVNRYGMHDARGRTSDPRRAPDPPKARDAALFESVLNPLIALYGTRGGHAAEAVRTVQLASDRIGYVRFQVFDRGTIGAASSSPCDLTARRETEADGRIDNVSMSWWLSGAVQEYLDRQLCHGDNVAAFSDQLKPELAR